ncbi:uncharacterized protein LOC131891960 [Tigriopus californicus]|uniref:uncharacterized protein LOC131891960 n=1 Tax=Tigriopus californicus TaxID=6832 RepID=UPI0027DA569F|nr:uncharacterized protein LOC131891960 [Tigriopus californicus]
MQSTVILTFFLVCGLVLLDTASAKFCQKYKADCGVTDRMISSYKQSNYRIFELRKCEMHCRSKNAAYVVFALGTCKCYRTCKYSHQSMFSSLLFPLGSDINNICR